MVPDINKTPTSPVTIVNKTNAILAPKNDPCSEILRPAPPSKHDNPQKETNKEEPNKHNQ
jgi:hypothetical protein